MDLQDRKIVALLSEDGDMTASEISGRIHLSVPAINKRIQRLKAQGVIRRFTVEADPEKIGKPISAYILVSIEHFESHEKLVSFVTGDPDISECMAVTGEYDYVLKVYASDIPSIEAKILKLKEAGIVGKTNTFFALKEYKHLAGPLPELREE